MSLIFNDVPVTSLVFNGTEVAQIILNSNTIWNYGNTIAMYYGGVTTSATNKITRLNAAGDTLSVETTTGTARGFSGCAQINGKGIFYGGLTGNIDAPTSTNTVSIIDAVGTLLTAETTTGTARECSGANADGYGIYFGSLGTTSKTTRLNNAGVQLGAEMTLGTARTNTAGVSISKNAFFFGGTASGSPSNKLTIINYNADLVKAETTLGTARSWLSSAGLRDLANSMNVGIFYGGNQNDNLKNTVTRINDNGDQLSSETFVGTARQKMGGASVGAVAIFYGGCEVNNTNITDIVTRMDANGVIVDIETNIGTARLGLTGCSY